jgi:hypothetical protein
LERAPQFFHNGRLAAEPGLLRAFLQVSTYVHDARSLAAILDMCALDGKLRFERSCLPAVHQLGLHTNAAEFLQLLQEDLTTLDASW